MKPIINLGIYSLYTNCFEELIAFCFVVLVVFRLCRFDYYYCCVVLKVKLSLSQYDGDGFFMSN